jgi:6-phosphogluconolactonase
VVSDTLPEGHRLRIYEDKTGLMDAAADYFTARLGESPSGPRVALAGGRTPFPVYERLSAPTLRSRVPWKRVRFVLTDERCVPVTDEESNFRMANEALFAPLGVPTDRLIRIPGEYSPEKAAEKTHKMLLVWAQRVPLFDLVVLGLGNDGHVASLFPAEAWPDFGVRLAVATTHPSGQPRVSLTPGALRSTRCTMFLVAGAEKAEAVRDSLQAAEASPRHPARMVSLKSTLWLLDRSAAALLPAAWLAEGEAAAEGAAD